MSTENKIFNLDLTVLENREEIRRSMENKVDKFMDEMLNCFISGKEVKNEDHKKIKDACSYLKELNARHREENRRLVK